VRHALIIPVALFLVACAPDLDANAAERCHEHAACSAGASCYRGFCVPDADDDASTPNPDTDPAQIDLDAGQGLLSSDSASASLADVGSIASDAHAVDTGATATPETDAAPRTGTERDAGVSTSAPRAKPAPDAPMPPANSPCTLTTCCEEAKKAYEAGEKRDGRWNLKKGKCGCSDPDLFESFPCTVSALAGSP
jgi:hypothetical protein